MKIFKTNAVECDYPTTNVENILNTKRTEDWNHDEYIVGRSNIELEKHTSLWSFNAYRNTPDFKKMMISDGDLNPTTSYMVSSTIIPFHNTL